MQLPGLVIGGGIAGLTAAIALHQRGIAATVCEAAPHILPLGAGIWMAPNAMQVFERLGLATKINAGGVPLRAIEITDGCLRPLLRTDQARIRQQFGHGTTAIRRATLQQILLAELDPATVRLGKACTALAPDAAGVTVTFADGTAHRAAFVVGADGIHSPVRGQLFPGVRPNGTGHLVWRGMSAVALAPRFRRAIREAWAGGLRFGFSEIADGVVDWFAAVPGAFGSDRAGLLGRLQAAFAGFAEPVPALLAAADEPAIIRNEVVDFNPLPCWHRGRIGLIGDAAHATTPYLGQGGCQAVEDAYALALCLHRHPADPARAFAELLRLRRAKARHVVRTSRLMGRIGYLSGAAAELRDLAIRATPRWVSERQFRQVYGLNY
ncbi:FAD-dependent monooxygenase [Hymenobacter sp.]|uniref:FAD-dependent monooxygenase n=1 Tax=Hymenobacter sp. TaxID=1898978 RepID=UPI00286C80D2|nr:FAD-dependent monooxygenase [Hymenobacter sp.]